VKVTTAREPMLVTFTQKVADLDGLLDPGDTVTLIVPHYATFVEDPIFERIKALRHRRDFQNRLLILPVGL